MGDQDTSEIRVYDHYVEADQTDQTADQYNDEYNGDTENDSNDDDTEDADDQTTTTTKRPVRQKSHFQVLKNQPSANRHRARAGQNGAQQSALEAEDLSNDEFFYKHLNVGVGEPAGDDVELIEPATTFARDSGSGKKSKKEGIDQDVELVQERRKTPNRHNEDSHKRYVDDEEQAEEEDAAESEAEENEGDSNHEAEQTERRQRPKSKPRQIQYTKQFDTKADLLKEVKQIVQKNQKLTKEADGDVYWEIEYEHPKY